MANQPVTPVPTQPAKAVVNTTLAALIKKATEAPVHKYVESDIKSGLWDRDICFKNGVQMDEAGGLLTQLFILNGDSAKAIDAAKSVKVAEVKAETVFVLSASKPVMNDDGVSQVTAARKVLTITGKQLIDRVAGILALHNSEIAGTWVIEPKRGKKIGGNSAAAALLG